MERIRESDKSSRLGLLLGCLAVLCWSFGSSFVYLGARELSAWHFICLTTLIGGGIQMVFRRVRQGELHSAIFLPGKLWLIVLFGFVAYGLVFPWSLVLCTSDSQVCAANLINYLWPVLTILFSVLWVPNTRFTVKLLLAILLALSGLVLANIKQIGPLLSETHTFEFSSIKYSLPYLLALTAAISWAVYSSFLVRWKAWAKNYTTSAIGFLIISIIAGAIALFTKGIYVKITFFGILMAFLYGLGPLAAGYLLWELALSRAKVQTLSLLASVTPILSILLLCIFLRFLPGPELIAAALLISGGVILSIHS
ncbi:MAG: EamA family transporter [Phycisphaerae bacterium]